MRKNPFGSAQGLRHSHYCLAVGRELKYTPKDPLLSRLALEVFHGLQEMIVDAEYPCIGAQAAFRQESYRLGVYPALDTEEAAAGMAYDLFTFVEEQRRTPQEFATFVAAFASPTDADEAGFEARLWGQLHRLHELDRGFHRWNPEVSSDPAAADFSYSFAETAFFVVGMHAGSSRPSRRFPYPLLVLNGHAQFQRLRETGVFERMRGVIRQRELAAHGSLNPMLEDFGAHSEARQYSGRAVGTGWRCPFHPAPEPAAVSVDTPEPAAVSAEDGR